VKGSGAVVERLRDVLAIMSTLMWFSASGPKIAGRKTTGRSARTAGAKLRLSLGPRRCPVTTSCARSLHHHKSRSGAGSEGRPCPCASGSSKDERTKSGPGHHASSTERTCQHLAPADAIARFPRRRSYSAARLTARCAGRRIDAVDIGIDIAAISLHRLRQSHARYPNHRAASVEMRLSRPNAPGRPATTATCPRHCGWTISFAVDIQSRAGHGRLSVLMGLPALPERALRPGAAGDRHHPMFTARRKRHGLIFARISIGEASRRSSRPARWFLKDRLRRRQPLVAGIHLAFTVGRSTRIDPCPRRRVSRIHHDALPHASYPYRPGPG